MKVPFAFYDFDDTLLKHDSMGFLFFYYVKKHPLSFFRGFWIGFLFLLYLLKIVSFQKVKEALIFPLAKMSDEEIKQFYEEELIGRYYPEVLASLKEHAANGLHVWLVSASPEPYLFYTDLPVEKVIGTSILRKDGHWTNKMISKNCKGEEKVERIKQMLEEVQLEIDFENSYGYSDSDSDWPMLLLVKNRYRINKKNGKIMPFVKGA